MIQNRDTLETTDNGWIAVALGVTIALLAALSSSLYARAEQAEKTVANFEAEPKVQQMAEAYSLDMVDYAKKQFGIELNWSDESIRQIEQIADTLHKAYEKDRPPIDKIAPFYKMMGSYIGEVFRRNYGAEWGWVILEGNRFPGMQRKPSNLFWPWGKAQHRIVNGSEDNLWHYYAFLLRQDEPGAKQ